MLIGVRVSAKTCAKSEWQRVCEMLVPYLRIQPTLRTWNCFEYEMHGVIKMMIERKRNKTKLCIIILI